MIVADDGKTVQGEGLDETGAVSVQWLIFVSKLNVLMFCVGSLSSYVVTK
jgi:hypothetical protein